MNLALIIEMALKSSVTPQVEKSDSCRYLQTAQYRASCKLGVMPVLDSWYWAEGWRGTGIVQPQY